MEELGDEGNLSMFSEYSATNASYNSYPVTFGPEDGLIVAVLFVIMILTVAGNVMTVASFAIDDKLRTNVSNWYLLNLSCADLLVGCVSLPFNVAGYVDLNGGGLTENLCKFYLNVDLIATWESIAAIILISLDRYWLLTKELQYKMKQNRRHTVGLCAVTWLIVTSTAILLVWGYPEWVEVEYIDYRYTCDLEFLYHTSSGVAYSVLSFFIPLAVLIYLNTQVFINVRKRSQKTSPSHWELELTAASTQQTAFNIATVSTKQGAAAQSTAFTASKSPKNTRAHEHGSVSNVNEPERGQNKANRRTNISGQDRKYIKTAKVLLIIVGAYVLCWAPYNMALVITFFCQDCIPTMMWTVSLRLLWFNSALNPFLYAWSNSRIRQNFKKLLLCRSCDVCRRP
ncbi:probable G-protein coupled receptor No18 [Ptychodera flava]|uniref:probable G-protein coupled receptor No18 n=1 Tax=Ptychodera flava TaxID=63121 RepID=UPI00396A3D9A